MIRLAAMLTCLALEGCGSARTQETNPETNAVDLGAEVTLAPGAMVRLKGVDMQVRFVAVTKDSRCPRDVTCIWAGEVKVQLETHIAKVASQLEILGGGSAAVGEYRITLLRVEPSRTNTARTAPQDYRASLKIDRLN